MQKSLYTSRGVPVCGVRLRELRKRRGWTQQDLAQFSGYSDRLIRKAEAGGTVSEDTLEVLAQTLSDGHSQVSIDDISLSARASSVVLQETILNRASIDDLIRHSLPNICVDSTRIDRRLPLHGFFQRQNGLIDWCSAWCFLTSKRISYSNIVILDNSRVGYLHAEAELQDTATSVLSFSIDLRFHLRDCLIDELVILSSLEECATLADEWEQYVVSQYLNNLKKLYLAKDVPIYA